MSALDRDRRNPDGLPAACDRCGQARPLFLDWRGLGVNVCPECRAEVLAEAESYGDPDDGRARIRDQIVPRFRPDVPLDAVTAARALGLSPRRLRELAVSRGVGTKRGRDWRFSREDIEAMRERRPGRPRRA